MAGQGPACIPPTCLRLVPLPKRAGAAGIPSETGEELWYWMIGRVSAMATLGVMTGLGLWARAGPFVSPVPAEGCRSRFFTAWAPIP